MTVASAPQIPARRRGATIARENGSLFDRAFGPIQHDLQAVTDRLLEKLTDPVARKVVYLITAGGKRLRPALVLLAGSLGPSPDRAALIDTAAAVEMIHTATLIHDDIIDQSTLRRRQPTFHHRWGAERALLMGDYLYATAFTLITSLETPYAMRVIAAVCQELSRGELLEVEARYRLELREAEYLRIIGDKTASLIGGCCRTGAYLGGSSRQTVDRLADFGYNFGLAFQIVDDCLDLTGNQREMGKSIHADMGQGAVSLPIIYLAQSLSARQRRTLFAPLRKQARDPSFMTRIAKAAVAAGAVAKAEARARDFARAAADALRDVSAQPVVQVLAELTEYAITRRG